MPKTIKEISSDLGVSVTTVRLIIGGQAEKYRISASTRQRVEDYIAAHGYVLHHAARSLKLKRTDTIGMVVPDLANPFFAGLLAALERHCRTRGLVLLSASTNDDPGLETLMIDSLLARGVDGLVIAPCRRPDHKQLYGRKSKIAVVLVDRNYPQDRYPTVTSENYNASLSLTRSVTSAVDGPVDFLCADTSLPTIRDRIRGFGDALAERGTGSWESFVHAAREDSAANGRRLMHALLESGKKPPRAFLTSSLLVLEGAIQQLKLSLGAIPPELLIGTFDDHAMLDFLPNTVFSVAQDVAAMAALAFAAIERQLNGAPSETGATTVPCQIVRRN